jgi:hypothetical protein
MFHIWHQSLRNLHAQYNFQAMKIKRLIKVAKQLT